MEISQGVEGSFFFEGAGIVHLPYIRYKVYEGEHIGWTKLLSKPLKYKTTNSFNIDSEHKRIGFLSSIRGIKSSDGYYYLFANGEDCFFNPGTIGQRSKDLTNWEPFPSFNNYTYSEDFQKFIGVDIDSQGNLYSCFSDSQGFIYGFDNFSFYFFQLNNNNWHVENITFDGGLEHLAGGYFTVYKDKPVICWNFYNSSLDLIVLNLSIKEDTNFWNNFTISYPYQDLTPVGFEEKEDELDVYFSGLSYYGENNASNFNQTSLFCTKYSENTVSTEILLIYPERIYINENCFHQWDNGSLSLFFERFKNSSIQTFYGIFTNNEITLTEIAYNDSTSFRKAHQFDIKDDKIYLLWNEYFIDPIDYNKDYYKMYFGIIPLGFPLNFEKETIDCVVEWSIPLAISFSKQLESLDENTDFLGVLINNNPIKRKKFEFTHIRKK